MTFLTKIRERQFAKKGGTYNLSRAVLAGVLAAGCLMPGFAEAAPVLETWPDYNETSNWDLEHTPNEYTVTIKGVTNDGLEFGDIISINWLGDNEESVEGCKINVNYDNSNDPLTITPEIAISGGYVDAGNALSNSVNISNVTFKDSAYIYGGCSGYPDFGGTYSYGGRTINNGTVTGNKVTISGNTTYEEYSEIYGGYTSGDGTVTGNIVEISGNTKFKGYSNIYGGYSSNDTVTGNKVEISGNTKFERYSAIYGGCSESGDADGNIVSISGGEFNGYVAGGSAYGRAYKNIVNISGGELNGTTVHGGYSVDGQVKENSVSISDSNLKGDVYGGYSDFGVGVFSSGDPGSNGTVTDNTVTIKDTTFTSTSNIYGGYTSGNAAVTGNTVEISGNTTFAFAPTSKIYGGYSVDGQANGNSVSISDDGTFNNAEVRGGYSKYDTASENSVSISGGEFNSAVFGGDSDSDTANYNKVIISGGEFSGRVYGGRGATKAEGNSVSISGGEFNGDVYGGYGKTANGNSVIISGGNFDGGYYPSQVTGGHSAYGTANGNSVIISGGRFININVHGGRSDFDTANGNSVIISGGEFNLNVWGGYSQSGEAKNNKVILVGKNATYPLGAEQTLTGSGNIEITGVVAGGLSHSTASGNEIHVYGSNTKVGKIEGFNTLRFFIDDKMTFGETMLTINGVSYSSNVNIPNDKLAVTVSGKPDPSVTNTTDNTITLVDYPNGTIDGFENDKPVDVKIGATLSGNGTVALEDNKKLVLTLNVEKTTVNENGKSLVETRAAAAFVVNNMSDFMLGTGMEQAKAAAGGVTPIDEGKLTPFAAVGGSNMRYITGSYVDVNGWNGAVGFAKQADKLLFGVAVEHGRGNYDSYLDNGVHASGDIKSTGGVIFGEYKLDNGVHYDAALRAGRVKSDYSSTATSYDESSTYYGFSLGGGKELTVSDKATVDVYGRYYFSHTNGSDVSIATGEEIDFDAVNSHRLRIGGRYTTTLTEKSKAYAGLAWQYEFGGDAKAAINGYSAPTPSLQGHSAIVEAGYKLNAGKNLTLDFNLNGAMGKQRGIGGGIGAQWLF